MIFSICQFLVRDSMLIFWRTLHGIPINSEYSQELCRRMNNVSLCGHLPHFLFSKIDPSIRYIVSAKIFPALLLCRKNRFCSKVHINDFYLLLHSIASSWMHIGVKRISQTYCLHHLKNMEKYCKTQLWDEKQNRMLFWTIL